MELASLLFGCTANAKLLHTSIFLFGILGFG